MHPDLLYQLLMPPADHSETSFRERGFYLQPTMAEDWDYRAMNPAAAPMPQLSSPKPKRRMRTAIEPYLYFIPHKTLISQPLS